MQVKKETLPTRCEVCHKSDRFNPETNICTRCSGVAITMTKTSTLWDGFGEYTTGDFLSYVHSTKLINSLVKLPPNQKFGERSVERLNNFSHWFRLVVATIFSYMALAASFVSFAAFCKYVTLDWFVAVFAIVFFGKAVATYMICSDAVRRIRGERVSLSQ